MLNQALTSTEAAGYLGVRPLTLRHWRWQGKGPAYVKVGGGVRYLKADLDTWLTSCRVEPQPRAAA